MARHARRVPPEKNTMKKALYNGHNGTERSEEKVIVHAIV